MGRNELEIGRVLSHINDPERIARYFSVKPWPHQFDAYAENIKAKANGEQSFVTEAPTGAGKSEIFSAIIKAIVDANGKVAIYCCRNLLIEQLADGCKERGIAFGTIAAAFDKEYWNPDAPVQLCSLATVAARMRKEWLPPVVDLVVVDEAHQQKEQTAIEIFDHHKETGASLAGFTATPVGISHIYDRLIQVVTKSQLRDSDYCNGWPAHLPALTFGCPEFDTRDLKPVKTGEFSVNDIRKSVWTPKIFGHVYSHYRRLNKGKRPAVLFAPGVKESKWFVDQFETKSKEDAERLSDPSLAIRAAHIDGEDCYVDGEEYKSDRGARKDIIARVREGDIHVLCNRFVLREGIDIPELFHLILACPIGSIVSYVQTVGRVLRNHSSLKGVIVQDHGGNWWRHGDPNHDIDWQEYFHLDARTTSKLNEERKKNGEEECAIICPNCSAVRESGAMCHVCGFKHEKSRRMVIQKNGDLQCLTGSPIQVKKVRTEPNTVAKWKKCYHRARRSGQTFTQAMGLFVKENKYYAPNNLPHMPKKTIDWYRKIEDVHHYECYPDE